MGLYKAFRFTVRVLFPFLFNVGFFSIFAQSLTNGFLITCGVWAVFGTLIIMSKPYSREELK